MPSDPNADQMQHQLLQLAQAVAEHSERLSAMHLVLRAAVETHPERDALLRRLDYLIALRNQTDQAQPMTDEEIRERRELALRWKKWIEEAP